MSTIETWHGGRRRSLVAAFVMTVLASMLLFAGQAAAQGTSESSIYLDIYDTEIEGRLEFAVADINAELDLGIPDDEDAAASVLDEAVAEIRAYASPRFALGSGGETWTVGFLDEYDLRETDLGLVVVLPFEVVDGFDRVPATVDVVYEAFVLGNPEHRGYFHIGNYWEGGIFGNENDAFPSSFDADVTRLTFTLDDPDFLSGLWGVVDLGVDHIRLGTDHILFLVALLLPAVLLFTHKWEPAPSFSSSLWRVLKIATSFTVAHSIALSLAGFGVIELPTKPVEMAIAISIILAALHNFFPIFQDRVWVLAFGLGLVHGLGFADAFTDFGLDRTNRVWSVIGFNLGIEIGQIVIMILVFPALFLLRRTRLYHVGFFRIGSVLLMLVAAIWAVERLLDADSNVSELIDPLVDLPWAYLYIVLFTIAAAGWRYREMTRENLIWLPDAEDLVDDDRRSVSSG